MVPALGFKIAVACGSMQATIALLWLCSFWVMASCMIDGVTFTQGS
jgi:hypothetical protein